MCHLKVMTVESLINEAFIPLCNRAYDKGKYVDEKLFIDLRKSDCKNLFIHVICDIIKSKSTFGSRIIIVDTCKPILNWRGENSNKIEIYNKFKIIEKSIMVECESTLDDFILTSFSKIERKFPPKKFSGISFLRGENICAKDLISIIIEVFGKEVYQIPKDNHTILQDENDNYFIHVERINKIPSYLIQKTLNKIHKGEQDA